MEARLDALSVRIDELKKGLDQAMQQLGQMNAAPGPASPPTAANAALEDRLTKIEQQVEQLQHAPPVASSSAPAVPVAAAQMTENTADTPAVPSPVHKKPMPKHKKAKTAAQKTAKPATTPVKWVLRAATPDEAWVAKDESSSELHHVRVGDELSGIGHVTAITQTGDSWTIQGSAGTVH